MSFSSVLAALSLAEAGESEAEKQKQAARERGGGGGEEEGEREGEGKTGGGGGMAGGAAGRQLARLWKRDAIRVSTVTFTFMSVFVHCPDQTERTERRYTR